MAKSVKQTYLKRKGILIASSCISGLAVCFLISALATDFWITCGEDRGEEGYANVHYGLFKGRKDIKINILAASSYDIFIICDEGMKECMYSCAATEESRLKVLQNAIAGINTGENCDQGSENRPLYASLLTKDAGFTGKEVNGTSDKVDLVSYELWLSTVIFLAFAIVMSLVTFGFTVYNALGNPILTIVGPRGLYIWNGASIFLCIFPLTPWEAQLIVYLSLSSVFLCIFPSYFGELS
ncbi:uncharacterized protein LOC136026891 isoform X2 [Artemia franciscana]|uniref:uncharacterized protein LOC136026891 isoform X2 n=1 Tax=Artemia franciscana TaxID=6661 RepID=UPI0032DAB29B